MYYRHLAVGANHSDNTLLLSRIYRSFVFWSLKKLVVKEQKSPGSIMRNIVANKAIKRRIAVSNGILRTLGSY